MMSIKVLTENPDEFLIRNPLPALPIFGTVSAATPIPSQPLETLPAISSSLSVPEKPVPSVPGPTRVSEIMRFGFPGVVSVI